MIKRLIWKFNIARATLMQITVFLKVDID